MNYSEEEIEMAFEHFAAEAQRIVSEYMDTHFPTLPKEHIEVDDNGHVYWKLFKVSEPDHRGSVSRSIYAFVRKNDGAIFKAASYRAPYTKGKSAIRGYVTDEWASSLITAHGVIYAR
tara:strand:- start:1983 stop:2336 length:354 start_codon:yes stop_codon:yes gene_type:complete